MKFRFPYENVLKNKKLNRDVAYRNFTEATEDLTSSQQKLDGFHGDIRSSRNLNQEIVSRGFIQQEQIEMLKWTQQFLEGQAVKIERQKKVLQEKQVVVEEKTLALSEAAKEMKIFEKLRERMKEKFKKVQKKHELKAVDEIVIMRAARKGG